VALHRNKNIANLREIIKTISEQGNAGQQGSSGRSSARITAGSSTNCPGWYSCDERDKAYKLAKIAGVEIRPNWDVEGILENIATWASGKINSMRILGVNTDISAYKRSITGNLGVSRAGGSFRSYINGPLSKAISIAKYGGNARYQGRTTAQSESNWKAALDKLVSSTTIDVGQHHSSKQTITKPGRPERPEGNRQGEEETRGEVQRDPDKPVAMNIEQAYKYAREQGAPHLALPDGDPNKRDDDSIKWSMNGRGNRDILLKLADNIDAAAKNARAITVQRAQSAALGENLGKDLGVYGRSKKFQQSFQKVWRDDISPMLVNAIEDFKVYTFADVVRKYAEGTGTYSREVVFVQEADASDKAWNLVDPETYDVENWDEFVANIEAKGGRAARYIDDPSTSFEDMVEAIRQSASTLDRLILSQDERGIFDPDASLRGLTTPTAFATNMPSKAKQAITTGEVPTASDFATLMIHEFDHVLYGLLWGLGAWTVGQTHDVAHVGEITDVAQAAFGKPSAALLARAKMKILYPRSRLLNDVEETMDKRFKRNSAWIDMRLWNNPKVAFEVLSTRDAAENAEYDTNYGKVEAWMDYVFRLPRPSGGGVEDIQQPADAITDAEPVTDGTWVYMFGDGEKFAQSEGGYADPDDDEYGDIKPEQRPNPERKGSGSERGTSAGIEGSKTVLQGQGGNFHYISPQNAQTAAEIDARVVVTKQAMMDSGAKRGFSGNYRLTVGDLQKLASMTWSEIRSAGFPSNVAQVARILKPASEIDQDAADAFNGTGGADQPYNPSNPDAGAEIDTDAQQEGVHISVSDLRSVIREIIRS
tara:strand:+ start:13540 stop:16005 length:2466 start_codon:yes stop_codon:yes gene_type:complete